MTEEKILREILEELKKQTNLLEGILESTPKPKKQKKTIKENPQKDFPWGEGGGNGWHDHEQSEREQAERQKIKREEQGLTPEERLQKRLDREMKRVQNEK